jgi:hypothetical protein
MDDLFDKMQQIFSDPESMKQMQELADMLSDDENESSSQNNSNEKNVENSNEEGFFDFSKILKLTSIMGNSQNDSDTALLLALKPHLNEEKQKKIDKAVKILKILSIFNAAKGSGLLDNLI